MSDTPVRTVAVRAPSRAYGVRVGAAVLPSLGEIVRDVLGRSPVRAFLAHDDALPPRTIETARASLASAGFDVAVRALHAGEPEKGLPALDALLVDIARTRHERTEPVVALGGGVVGDLAGFAAAVYRRGVPVVQCPTTLLSMVDAAVGGKTGVNLRTSPGDGGLRKNLVGAFHQPCLVLADVGTLSTLPARTLRAGLAECVKHGLIGAHGADPSLLDWTDTHADAVLALEPRALVELVARNVSLKATIVGQDEREEAPAQSGGRALLNLGHTFGHAIETLTSLSLDAHAHPSPLQHGEAVSLGLVCALRCAETLGLLRDPGLPERVTALLTRLGLPTRVRGLPPSESVYESMLHDKKVSGGSLRLVLPEGRAVARVIESPDRSAVLGAIDAIRI